MADVHQLPGTGSPSPAVAALKPFRSEYEAGFVGEKNAPALVFNPHARPSALAAAALSRTSVLRSTLSSWSCLGDGAEPAAVELAQQLEPMANEVRLLLGELLDQLRQAERDAGEASSRNGSAP